MRWLNSLIGLAVLAAVLVPNSTVWAEDSANSGSWAPYSQFGTNPASVKIVDVIVLSFPIGAERVQDPLGLIDAGKLRDAVKGTKTKGPPPTKTSVATIDTRFSRIKRRPASNLPGLFVLGTTVPHQQCDTDVDEARSCKIDLFGGNRNLGLLLSRTSSESVSSKVNPSLWGEIQRSSGTFSTKLVFGIGHSVGSVFGEDMVYETSDSVYVGGAIGWRGFTIGTRYQDDATLNKGNTVLRTAETLGGISLGYASASTEIQTYASFREFTKQERVSLDNIGVHLSYDYTSRASVTADVQYWPVVEEDLANGILQASFGTRVKF